MILGFTNLFLINFFRTQKKENKPKILKADFLTEFLRHEIFKISLSLQLELVHNIIDYFDINFPFQCEIAINLRFEMNFLSEAFPASTSPTFLTFLLLIKTE